MFLAKKVATQIKQKRRRILLALLFLLLSFTCIFLSSYSALWFVNRSRIQASMLSSKIADYWTNSSLMLAPLNPDIVAEAAQDEALLTSKRTPIAAGWGVVILPNPVPTPYPTLIAVLPTPTPTASGSAPEPIPATPTPVGPPPTAPGPTATSVASTATSTLPTPAPVTPTTIPPTIAPTLPLPTTAAPTSTTIPPTGTSTTLPPATPTSTSAPPPTPTATATTTPTPTPTDTATPTATPTPTFTPTNTPTPTFTPTNTPVPPLVEFGSDNYSVNEGGGSTSIDVTLSFAALTTVTVEYATGDLSATAGSDYTAISGTLTFTPGLTSQSFPVFITDDMLHEPREVIQLALSNWINALPGTPVTASLTIPLNDDPGPGDPCAGTYPAGEPNPGTPNGNYVRIACEVGLIMDLGSTPIVANGDSNYDLVYYELRPTSTPTPTPPNTIFMDSVQLQIGVTPSGPWYTVFEWGDGINDTNTNLMPAYPDGGPGSDNTEMASPPLYANPGPPSYLTGIQIDVDNLPAGLGAAVPNGTYQYLRIYAPPIIGPPPLYPDGPEVDSIEVLP